MVELAPIRDVDEILQGPSSPVQRQSTLSAGRLMDNVLAKIDAAAPGLEQEFMRSFIESQFQQALGMPGFKIRSRAEREFEANQLAIAQKKQGLELSRLKVLEVSGFLLDNASRPVEEVLPGRTGQRTSLEELMNTKLDQSLFSDPEKLIAASRVLATELGEPGLELRTSDLLNFSETQKAASQTEEARGSEKASQEAQDIRSLEKIAEFQSQTIEGESAPARALQSRLKAEEEATGLRLTGGGDRLNLAAFMDHLDTTAGAQRFAVSLLDTSENSASEFGISEPNFLKAILQGEFGQRVVSELNDIEPDEEGNMPIVGDFGLEAGATAIHALLLDEVSKRTDTPLSELLPSIGLKFTGIRREDLVRARGILAELSGGSSGS